MNIIKESNKLIELGKRNTAKSVRGKEMTKDEAKQWNTFYKVFAEIARRVA